MIYSVSCFNLVGLGALFRGISPQNLPHGDGLILHRPGEYIRFTSSCAPTLCNKITPMDIGVQYSLQHVML